MIDPNPSQYKAILLGSVSEACRRPDRERTSQSARRPKQANRTYADPGQRSGWLVPLLEARHLSSEAEPNVAARV